MAEIVADQNSPHKEEDFSMIERLADKIRVEDDARITPEDRSRIVQDLYEGPRKCQCCINWVHDAPADADIETVEKDDNMHPLIVRRRVRPGEEKSQVRIHSIDVRNPEVRAVLFEVFQGYDNINPSVKHLIFRAPFRQFFWRWESFEKAIEEQRDEVVKTILLQLRSLVKAELAEAFAIKSELVVHGLITFKHLWVIFPPGELIYTCDDGSGLDGSDRFFLASSIIAGPQQLYSFALACKCVDWYGHDFGYAPYQFNQHAFSGTKAITHLPFFPAKYLPNLEMVQQSCIERGRRFQDMTGISYKSYEAGDTYESFTGPPPSQQSRRIVLDPRGHPSNQSRPLMALVDPSNLSYITHGIIQSPIDATPPGGHRPLVTNQPPGSSPAMSRGPRPRPGYHPQQRGWDDDDDIIIDDTPPRHTHFAPPHPGFVPASMPLRHHNGRTSQSLRRQGSTDSLNSTSHLGTRQENVSSTRRELTDLQLQLCNSRVLGFCLKDKAWRTFNVDRIRDIQWNTEPFESLVLPEGYKELILGFVESQLKEGAAFDDIINGKGGGLVILLAGSPGVGKTLTAESVAEKIHAPLYKMELAAFLQNTDVSKHGDNGDGMDRDISLAFEHAARWGAVLLIDECDMYLAARTDSDGASLHNRLVARFLQELEYYPSLLFLTTNRERFLDPAIYSRIHLTINYPALDAQARETIWRTFLGREEGSVVGENDMAVLAKIEVNGRRIRNITRTARIMARREGRSIRFEDIKKVMKITEGLEI